MLSLFYVFCNKNYNDTTLINFLFYVDNFWGIFYIYAFFVFTAIFTYIVFLHKVTPVLHIGSVAVAIALPRFEYFSKFLYDCN